MMIKQMQLEYCIKIINLNVRLSVLLLQNNDNKDNTIKEQ